MTFYRPALIVFVLASLAWIVLASLALAKDADRIHRLQRDVACLKHPTSMASSIGPVRIRNGKVIAGRTTPSVTVCP